MYLIINLILSLTSAFTQINVAWNAENPFENEIFVQSNQYFIRYRGSYYPTCLAHGEQAQSCPSSFVCSGAFGHSFGSEAAQFSNLERITLNIIESGCLDTSCDADDFLHSDCPPENCVTIPISTPLDGSETEPRYCINASSGIFRNGQAICSNSLQEDPTYFSRDLTDCTDQNRFCDDYIPDQFFLAESEQKLLEADIGDSDTAYISSNGQHGVWEAESMLLIQRAFVELDPTQQAEILPLIIQFESLSSLSFNDFFPSSFPSINPTSSQPTRWPTISLPTLIPTTSAPTERPSTSEPTPVPECTVDQLANSFCWSPQYPCKECCSIGKGLNGLSCWGGIYQLERCCGTTYSPTPTDPTLQPSIFRTSTLSPTDEPTKEPTDNPTTTANPSRSPSCSPTISPSSTPMARPTQTPSEEPSITPVSDPSGSPSANPTRLPSTSPFPKPTRDPTAHPTTDPTDHPVESPSLSPSFSPVPSPTTSPNSESDNAVTSDGWCVAEPTFESVARFEGTECPPNSLSTGARSWMVDGVTIRMFNRNLIQGGQTLCILDYGTLGDYQWAVMEGGWIYPTCVQASFATLKSDDLISASASLSGNANALEAQRVFDRNNFLAVECPLIQSTCRGNQVGFDGVINQWWRDSVSELIEEYGAQVPENFDANVCLGDDDVVRYVTKEKIVNTCTGYRFTDTESVSTTDCDGVNNWECGFKTFNPFTFQSPGYPVNHFRSIARAFASEDFVLPECSFSNNQWCSVASKEQTSQLRYADRSLCVDSTHPQYDASISSVLTRIQGNAAGDGNTYDLCYIADEDGDLEYVLFVNGVGYPTCVSAPTQNCLTNKLWCVEPEKSTWPGTIMNRLLSGKVFGSDSRANHQHFECPKILDICLPGFPSDLGGLTSYYQTALQPESMVGQFDNNLCVGRQGGIRVVTADGIQNSCTSFRWNTEDANPEYVPCPTERNFICGSLQDKDTGQKTFGWLIAQKTLIQEALASSGFRHPHCPYTTCREC